MPLIVFEGIDGSGTTTHSKALVERLGGSRQVKWTCQPTTGPIGVFVRSVFERKVVDSLPNWRAMMHLFQADREMHRDWLVQELKAGAMVVCDRYWLSGLAYQTISAVDSGETQDSTVDLIVSLNKHLPEPDLTIILDVSVEEGLRRLNKEKDLFEKESYLKRVKRIYDEICGVSIRHVDTEGRSVEETEAHIDRLLMESGF